MARPKISEPKKQYTVMLKPSVVKEIDRIAQKVDISRSQLMANLIEMGLDDTKILEKTKMLEIVKIAGKIGSKLRIEYISGKKTGGEEI